jgi:hypothetical protein
MAGVYTELRGFILAHRGCAGARHADLESIYSGWIPPARHLWLWRRVQAVGDGRGRRRRPTPLGAAGLQELGERQLRLSLHLIRRRLDLDGVLGAWRAQLGMQLCRALCGPPRGPLTRGRLWTAAGR